MIYGRKILLEPLEGELTAIPPAEKRFRIRLKTAEEAIGEVNYCGYLPVQRAVEIGVEIFPTWRGQGYGEDALYHFLNHLFDELVLKLVRLSVIVDNEAAHHLYVKLGFTDVKLQKHGGYDVEKEEFVDLVTMELTREMWFYHRLHYPFKD